MLMTREEAREFLLSIANQLGCIGVEDLTDRDGKRMIEAIKALEEPQWIPCSEKDHPDLPVRVQVQMTNGWIITAYYQDGEWLPVPNCEDAIHDEWIEAWRSLPEPWRGDAE